MLLNTYFFMAVGLVVLGAGGQSMGSDETLVMCQGPVGGRASCERVDQRNLFLEPNRPLAWGLVVIA